MGSSLDLVACRQQNYVAPPHMLELKSRATVKTDGVAEDPRPLFVYCHLQRK